GAREVQARAAGRGHEHRVTTRRRRQALTTTPLTAHNFFETVEGLVALGTLLLAAGTLVVAVVTGRTAHRTRELAEATVAIATSTGREVQAVVDQAEAARQEVEVSREALLATNRPRLVNVRLGWSEPNAAGSRSPDTATLIRISEGAERRIT